MDRTKSLEEHRKIGKTKHDYTTLCMEKYRIMQGSTGEQRKYKKLKQVQEHIGLHRKVQERIGEHREILESI